MSNVELEQAIARDVAEIDQLLAVVTQGRPLPAPEVLALYEQGKHARIGGHAPRSIGCRDLITLEVTLESLLATAAAEVTRREEDRAGAGWRDFAGSVRRAFLGVP